jgi:hypothetical protein
VVTTPRRQRRSAKCMVDRVEQDACPPRSARERCAQRRARSSNPPRSQRFRSAAWDRARHCARGGSANVTGRTHSRTDRPLTCQPTRRPHEACSTGIEFTRAIAPLSVNSTGRFNSYDFCLEI